MATAHGITLTANGFPLDTSPERFGELRDSSDLVSDDTALAERIRNDGYLFLRGLVDGEVIENARTEILQKYAILGEVDDRHPVTNAIAGNPEAAMGVNLRAFSTSVRSGYWYRQVTDNPELIGLFERLLGESVHIYDMRWPRFVRPGEGCGFHCDGPYMNRGSQRVHSSWIPLGRVHRHEGALMLLENSHKNQALRDGYLSGDADRDHFQWLDDDPRVVQQRYGDRWLTADFEAGDVLCFTMSTLHGALDNLSSQGRCRLSSDSRYQPAGEPTDERWNGYPILGHGGSRVFYPGLGRWNNEDFQDEWKNVDEHGRATLSGAPRT